MIKYILIYYNTHAQKSKEILKLLEILGGRKRKRAPKNLQRCKLKFTKLLLDLGGVLNYSFIKNIIKNFDFQAGERLKSQRPDESCKHNNRKISHSAHDILVIEDKSERQFKPLF